ncbi:MAG: hypothetical protein Q7S86_04580 [bacterium]|nr:hypothetical protein [bacterium]
MSPLDFSYPCLLREAFGTSGFTEIATVTIEQGEQITPGGEETLQYHLRTAFARNTGIFFAHKERGLLVQLDYDENDVMGHVDGYWKLRLYFQFQPVGELRKTGTNLRNIPFLTSRKASLVNSFHLVGKERENPLHLCYRYDQTRHGETIAPETLAQSIEATTDGVLQFLQLEPFTPTNTKDFPPRYAFAECENLFWQKFNNGSRRNIITVSKESLRGSPQVLEKTPILATQHA